MADPVQTQTYTSNIPQELLPYAERMLNTAYEFTDIAQNPYQQYQGERVAQTSPLLQQAMDTASQMGVAGQIGAGSALAGAAGLEALNPYSFTDAGMAQQYMSPYMQNVVDVQQQQAKRQAAIQNQALQAQAANAGAFGGGRQGIMNAQANAELQRNLQGIQATGLQNAYQQAAQQYNQEQTQRMQGLGLANQAASTLGTLGQNQFGQESGIVGLQGQLGQLEQQRAQQALDAQYQDYLNYQNYPYKQLGFMSDLIRGVPTTTSASSIYQAPPSTMQSLMSLGLGAYGLNSLFGGSTSTGKAAGGEIKGYAGGGTVGYDDGGSVFSPSFKDYAVSHIDPRMLPVAQRNAQARGDLDTAQYAMEQMAQDAALRRGIAGALPQGASVVRAAGGGILAFAGNDEDNDPTSGQLTGGIQIGRADPSIVRQAQKYIGNIDTFQPETLTPEQEDAAWQRAYEREQRIMGPNVAAQDMRKYLKQSDVERGEALSQAKGLGALEAAGAVLEGNDALRGLGRAGSAFSKTYGKALEADRREKRALAEAGYHLADSERKERAGNIKSADSALAAHKASLKEANKFNFDKLKAQADLTTKLANATRTTGAGGAGGAGKGPKINEQLAAAEIAYEHDPTDANLKTVNALRRAVTLTKTTDVGSTKADLARMQILSGENAKVQAAMNKFQFNPKFLEAKDPDAVWKEELEKQRGLFPTPGQNVNKNSGNSGRIKFDANGNPIP